MNVNYLSRKKKEESRHGGISLWLPQSSKKREKVVLSKYPPRGSDLNGIGPPNASLMHIVVSLCGGESSIRKSKAAQDTSTISG